MSKSPISKLSAEQERRERKYVNRYVVYGYRVDNLFTPNLLVLPKSSESANPYFVAENVKAAQKNGKFKIPQNLVLIRIGEFDVEKGIFTPRCHKIVYDFSQDFKEDK